MFIYNFFPKIVKNLVKKIQNSWLAHFLVIQIEIAGEELRVLYIQPTNLKITPV